MPLHDQTQKAFPEARQSDPEKKGDRLDVGNDRSVRDQVGMWVQLEKRPHSSGTQQQ